MTLKMIKKDLIGQNVSLELINEKHRLGLKPMADVKEIWTHITGAGFGEGYDLWFDDALQQAASGRDIIFIVRHNETGALIGSTRYTAIVPEHKRLEIGYTWYNPQFWGGVVNPNCKLLLCTHAFETMGANRVELKTSANNKRSQAAIKKLGGLYEGIFRYHMVNSDGTLRDTMWFAITHDRWDEVKAKLLTRLQAY